MVEIRQFIREKLQHLGALGEPSATLVSKDIQQEMGLRDRLPMVSKAMFQVSGPEDTVIRTTPSNQSSTIEIRYDLARFKP